MGSNRGVLRSAWSSSERVELFDWMAAWGLNTYVYAPKDDLHHRALWREPYATEEAERLRALIGAARARNIRFVYGISPGLDIHYRTTRIRRTCTSTCCRAQGRGDGRRMMEQVMDGLRRRGSPGAHLGVSMRNSRAQAFYAHLGFRELARTGSGADECLYMGIALGA